MSRILNGPYLIAADEQEEDIRYIPAPEPTVQNLPEELDFELQKKCMKLEIYWVIQDFGPAGIQEVQLVEQIQGKKFLKMTLLYNVFISV